MRSGRGFGRRPAVAAATVTVALAAFAAGCGSSDDDKSTAASSSGADAVAVSSGLKEAEAAMKAAATLPTELGLPPSEKPIPTGKTVTYVHCGVEVCGTIAAALKNAASILDWNVKVVASDGTPAGVKKAWAQVVRIKPDAAFGSGFDRALFAAELKKLKAMNIPVFSWASLDKSGDGITLVKGGPEDVPIVGEQMASWAVASAQGKANTVYVDLPTFTILQPVKKQFAESYEKWCPDCKLSTMSVPLTAIGSKAPGMVVSYLRAHPDINRVALSYDGIGVGLPAALKAAGLAGKVQFGGEAPTATNLSYVQSGSQASTVNQGYYEIWAVFLDAAARTLTGQSIEPHIAWKPPWFLATKDNLTSGSEFKPIVADLNEQLKKLWLKDDTA